MCGIAGIVGNILADACSARLTRMVEAQVHRGPDDKGIHILATGSGMVGLGHRRLAILDLSPLGHQPMLNPDTGDVIVYNGEIYNFRELRSELESHGITFRSASDTEVVLRAYEVWGKLCLERFRGMFAFGLWDAGKERLLLARDHLGIKPLYYANAGDVPFVFASEVKALTASRLLPIQIDRRALASYLAYGSVQAPLTLIENIRALDPATWVEVKADGRISAQGTYWRPPFPNEDESVTAQHLDEEARRILSASVSRHLVSDVPVGLFLSSGLDSTTVAGLVSESSPAAARSFTVSFAEVPDYNEGTIASETSRRFGLEHCDCPVSSQTILNWAGKALEVMDQPTMDGLNTYIVSRAVRDQGITVALSGQGGDEMFGGYPSFSEVPEMYRLLHWVKHIPAGLRAVLARIVTYPRNETYRKKAADIAKSGPNLLDLYFHRRRACSDSQMAALGFRADELGLTKNFQTLEASGSDCLVPNDPIASVGRLETKYYLGNTLLRDGDVFGMANSLEIRVPMLDRDIVEWIFKLPGEVLLPPGRPTKYLLRKACSDLHPAVIATQRKRGFVVPVAHWMRGPLRGVMSDGIEQVKQSQLVNHNGVSDLLRDFDRNPNSPIWSRVWALAVLGHWLRRVSNGDGVPAHIINSSAAEGMTHAVA